MVGSSIWRSELRNRTANGWRQYQHQHQTKRFCSGLENHRGHKDFEAKSKSQREDTESPEAVERQSAETIDHEEEERRGKKK